MSFEESEAAGPVPEWPSDWMRAVLGVFTLRALEQGASYGYAIIAELEANGLGTVKGGTLYPLLSRYESVGFVSVEWRPGEGGPGRKYFSLTERGRIELERTRTDWLRFAAIGGDFLNTARTGETETP